MNIKTCGFIQKLEFVLKLYIFKNGSFIKFKATKIVTELYNRVPIFCVQTSFIIKIVVIYV